MIPCLLFLGGFTSLVAAFISPMIRCADLAWALVLGAGIMFYLAWKERGNL